MTATVDVDSVMTRLKNQYQDIYKARKQIIERRIKQKINELGGNIVQIKGDGNCLITALLYHIGQEASQQNVLAQRRKLGEFMNNHKHAYKPFMDETQNIEEYTKNYVYLGEIHLRAIHKLHKINILVFEYDEQYDGLSQNYYHHDTFKNQKCVFLLYTRYNKHYDYCSMGDEFKSPSQAGYFRAENKSKYDDLIKFDQVHDVTALVECMWMYCYPKAS